MGTWVDPLDELEDEEESLLTVGAWARSVAGRKTESAMSSNTVLKLRGRRLGDWRGRWRERWRERRSAEAMEGAVSPNQVKIISLFDSFCSGFDANC